MHRENKSTPRGPMGRKNFNITEKAKNFKLSVKRLIIELKIYKGLILLSLFLAALGSIILIAAPSQLSKLTDEIGAGLNIKQNKLSEIIIKIKNNKTVSDILNINLSTKNINNILNDENIKLDDKKLFSDFLANYKNNNDQNEIFENIKALPDSILKSLFSTSLYNQTTITVDEKISILKLFYFDKSEINLNDSVKKILFTDIILDDVLITANDQYSFLKILGTLQDKNEISKKINDMPQSIKSLISSNINMVNIKNITTILLIIYFINSIFTYIESFTMNKVANKFARKLRTGISKKINKLPLKYFDKNSIGDILSRVTNDVDMIAQSMNQSLSILVSSFTLFIGTIIMMFYTNWIMALTAIISSLSGFIGMIILLIISQKYFMARQTELGNLNGHIEEVYSGLNIVKVYNGKEETAKKFDDYNHKVGISNRKSIFFSGLMIPVMDFIGNFGYVCVCIVGALLTLNNLITFGVIIAFITYVRLFTSPLTQIAEAMSSLQSTVAASERVFEFIDEQEMSVQNHEMRRLEKELVKGNIEFDNVVFKYEGNDEPTIKNFTVSIKAGQKIAIVGPTGAGKTTIVNLLMKFYEINSGDIKIEGISTKKLTRENIHQLFTMVLQDTWLFNGTIKENIIYNRLNVSDKTVVDICKRIGLDHFIKTLPEGYNTILEENESISAGQKQLLTIARGMIEDLPFLILDEATSNVDTRTEELVQSAMDKLTHGRTSFIIAHRLSTIKNADLILVMQNGNIIEQGKHYDLMNKNGFYTKLYNSQFEL